jgi:hypothetical protein
MNGYLMQEQDWVPGQDLFIESFSPESRYGEAAYFYAVEKDSEGMGVRVLDALHIHESEDQAGAKPSPLKIVWSRDWMKCALVIDGYCHALFDFEAHGGYNINEFPPPNDFWSMGDRKLSDELIQRLF